MTALWTVTPAPGNALSRHDPPGHTVDKAAENRTEYERKHINIEFQPCCQFQSVFPVLFLVLLNLIFLIVGQTKLLVVGHQFIVILGQERSLPSG